MGCGHVMFVDRGGGVDTGCGQADAHSPRDGYWSSGMHTCLYLKPVKRVSKFSKYAWVQGGAIIINIRTNDQ